LKISEEKGKDSSSFLIKLKSALRYLQAMLLWIWKFTIFVQLSHFFQVLLQIRDLIDWL